MKFIKRVFKFILYKLSENGLLMWIPDKNFLKVWYRSETGKKLNLDNPQTFNEKLQWLKLYNRKPEYTLMVDKYAVRQYVTEKIGEDYLFPLFGVWNTPEEIDFDLLPNEFVLKTNHDSGGVIICKNKEQLDRKKAIKFLKKRQKTNFYWIGREWPYKNVEKKILAEKFMVDESGYELRDYKFLCFNGECKAMFIVTDRGGVAKFDFFDRDFNRLPFRNAHPNSDKKISKPDKFDEMIRLAEKLSEGMPHVRVDLYNINGKIYFGELTFFWRGGAVPFRPAEWDYKLGEWIKLPKQ